MGHPHVHLPAGGDRGYRRLATAFGLVSAFLLIELVTGAVTGSLTLLADAGHMLTDAGAMAGAMWAARLARRPPSRAWTFGLPRAEILAAAVNGVTLLVAAALVTFEAVQRLAHPPHVAGAPLVVVAVAGAAVNVAALRVLAGADRHSLNVRAALQHVLTDLFAFAGTAVAGVVLIGTGWRRADPVASLFVVLLLLRAAAGLLSASGRVLLEGTPQAVDLDDVRTHLSELPEVQSVHDLHAWTLTSDLPVLSAHVVVSDACLRDGSAGRVLDRLQECLAGHFDVEHSTFQLEPAGHVDHEPPVHD